eukprot:2725919-Pleurochrysis_carterae.AAC.4
MRSLAVTAVVARVTLHQQSRSHNQFLSASELILNFLLARTSSYENVYHGWPQYNYSKCPPGVRSAIPSTTKAMCMHDAAWRVESVV